MEFYSLRRTVICDTLDRYPDMGSHTMARLLQRKYPEMFPSHEVTRNAIRYLRGVNGIQSRRVLKDKKYVR